MTTSYQSVGDITGGALVGPGGLLNITPVSPKMAMQADGKLRYQPHNLFANSGSPATQAVTVISGATYKISVTGASSVALSGAGSGTATDGSPVTVVASTTTLTCTVSGATAGDTVQVRELPSPEIYVATGANPVYDLPYVYANGACSHIRVEPDGENLWSHGLALDNAAWTKTSFQVTITPDALASVIEGFSYDKIVSVAGGPSIKRLDRSISKDASVKVYTASFVLKAAEWSFFHWQFDPATAAGSVRGYIDLSDGSVSSTTNTGSGWSATQEAEDLGNGEYRLKVTVTTDNATTLRLISSISDTSTNTATGDGSSGLYAMAFQLEEYPVATSIMLTPGAATRDRGGDTISLSTDDFSWDDTTGTVYIEWSSPEADINKGHGVLGFAGSSSTFAYANTATYYAYDGVTSALVGSRAADTVHKEALAWDASGYQHALNGAAATEVATALDFVDSGDVLIGNRTGSTAADGVTDLHAFAILPRKMSEAELEARTN